MITMAAGEPPLIGADPPFDRLGTLRTRTFHMKAGHQTRGLAPSGGQPKSHATPCRAIGQGGAVQ
jgi:hypothetical protein